MKRKNLLLLAPLMLLAACSSVRDSDKDAASSGGGYTTAFPGAGTGGTGGVEQSNLNSNLSPQQQLAQIGDRVFFGVDQFEVSPESAATLDKQADWLRANPAITLTIEGHCDERGTREYNLALGQKRADSVRRYLAANGIDNSRLQTLSFGKERPAVAGSSADVWAQNRRAVSVVN
ncbi:peptidoglycan-associated lipoprotein Pal [Niveispirillum sp.]|uniref:peptidoglycan-associated lipoprotein Pal n=1 Tax=Niveispirillum sp. TaxID=1917217 RepID=UPI001B471B00|nr:peptidoglycan-associated lipoprotein Pal [Niveispirillum sp.]MBP7336772.1 peptidoglycan-associated lipoprotein Pal [Niveispirillum sp.]